MKNRLLHFSLILLMCLLVWTVGSADASNLVTQTAVPGTCIPMFSVPLPVFGPAGPIPRVDATNHPNLTVTMKEINQTVLPQGTFACPSVPGGSVTFGKTRVWAYQINDTLTGKKLAPANWPAVTVEAKRFRPVQMKYVNDLPTFNVANPTGPGLVQGLISVDQTIDFADVLGTAKTNNDCTRWPQILPIATACLSPYVGPAPAVAHLHGGEVQSGSDGGPLGWFTPNGIKGMNYKSFYNAGPGAQVSLYPNDQEPGTLWFHDHTMGQTRTNVYSGLAAFYFLRKPANEPKNLPAGPYEIELAIQDRQFDTTGQLYFPDGSDPLCGTGLPGDPCLNGPPPNSDNTAGSPAFHPFWIPEFVGDVIVVNGAPWPTFNVEPRRYRLRVLDGSNARGYNMYFGTAPVYQIGADDNYLDAPVVPQGDPNAPTPGSVFLLPGERADIIVDFTNLAGQTVTVTNDAPVPYPGGLVPGTPGQENVGNIMQFVVAASATSPDTSCNPSVAGQCTRPTPIVRLADGDGHVVNGVKIDKVRRMTLREFEGDPYNASPGGPAIVLVNNTQFMGLKSPNVSAYFPTDGISEKPRQGSIELWEIVNMTVDEHPMHTHLVQFQVVNREAYDVAGYIAAYDASFPADTTFSPLCTGGVFCPGWGPPLPYKTAVYDEAFVGGAPIIGGNPSIAPFLSGVQLPPSPEESGWKDTAKADPGKVLRLLVRFTPTDVPMVPNTSFKGLNFFPFDPKSGPGYVWHCHIVDHEDQDMMRPFKVVK